MAQWQYKFVPFTDFQDAEEFEEKLNEFGADGWEIFEVNQSGNKAQIIMKRPGAEGPEAVVLPAAGTAGGSSP